MKAIGIGSPEMWEDEIYQSRITAPCEIESSAIGVSKTAQECHRAYVKSDEFKKLRAASEEAGNACDIKYENWAKLRL